MPDSTVRVALQARVSGPLFDGVAQQVIGEVVHDAAKRLADRTQGDVRRAAAGFDRSGRGHGAAGAAYAGVIISEHPGFFLVYGKRDPGKVWWPYLEGRTQRNRDSRFKGYHTFANARKQADEDAVSVLRAELDKRLGEIGGE